MEDKRRFAIDAYCTYIVDVDGTLYFKRPMQLQMLFRLLQYYSIHFSDIKELLLLKDYRKLRDMESLSECEDAEKIILDMLCNKYHISKNHAQKVIDYWIVQYPLNILYECRDVQLLEFLHKVFSEGKMVYIYSDYPAAAKCRVLNVSANKIYWPDGNVICTLKPNHQGLKYIIESNGLDRSKILFIGDRMEKDGICAQRCNVDYLILKKHRIFRKKQYLKLMNGET